MKKITIGIVTFDRTELLKRAVQSVLSQSYKNFIILIGNDNPKIKLNYKKLGLKKNKNIKIFNYKKNIGERKNLNFLLKKTNTELFCWLGDDDYLHQDFFKHLIIPFKNNQNLVASYSNYSRAHLKLKTDSSKHIILNQENFLEGFTSKRIRLIGTFGLLKTRYLKKIGGIHKTGKSFLSDNKITHHYPYCDPLIAIMLSNFGQISWIDKRLIHLNTDLNSVSSKTDDYGAYTSAENYVLNKLNKSTKKIKNTQTYFVIYSNISDWFIHIRLTTIKKRDFLLNVKYILVYFFDLFKLTVNKKGVSKISFIIVNLLRIIKSMN